MNKNKLKKIKRKIRSLRAGAANIQEHELVSIAKKLERRRFDTGKHPTYISDPFPDLRPISIPSHRKFLAPTAQNILDDLENDVRRWQDELNKVPNPPNANE